jgi:hypothetical protein
MGMGLSQPMVFLVSFLKSSFSPASYNSYV